MGIEQVEELAATPPVVLRRWFGAAGDLLHRWANGQDHAWVTPDAQVKSISRETTFAQDVVDGPLLRGMLRYLSERVGAQLRREGKAARCVTLRLRYARLHHHLPQPDAASALPGGRDDLRPRR